MINNAKILLSGKISRTTIMKIIDLKNLATLIRNERKKQNLTQSDLAFACNVGLRFIVDLERAKPTCQIGKVLNVINTLGIELEIKDL